MPRGSPFHSRTSALCESHQWLDFYGYLAAASYDPDFLSEFYTLRIAAGLIDVSSLFKYRITGPDAARLLNRMITRDVAKCAPGQVMYAIWCDEQGHVIDDGTLMRLDEDDFRLTSAIPNFRYLLENAVGLNVEIEDVTDSLAALALQGPLSRDILQALGLSLEGLKFFRLTPAAINEIPVIITRTGYTGDLGYEIWVDADQAEPVWDAVMDAGQPFKMRPVGLAALDIARIEAGLLLIDVDFISSKTTLFGVQKSTPAELGLGWMVSFDKGNFVGRDALMEEKKRGPAWTTVGLEPDWSSLEKIYGRFNMPPQFGPASWTEPVPVYANGKWIGKATSGLWSPILKKNIAIARVKPEYGKPGARIAIEVTAEAQRFKAKATVVKMPFFNPQRKTQ